MRFVRISELTAIISLYNINWLVFIPRRSVFTPRYGLGIYVCFKVLLLFKVLIKTRHVAIPFVEVLLRNGSQVPKRGHG
jgi:hypothetical protein